MTRFARAKGSKASNERLPNEATPWHVMKQQLQENLSKTQESSEKTKSAKQLLETVAKGNDSKVSNSWAEFPENSENKKSKKNKKGLNKIQGGKHEEEKSLNKPEGNTKSKKRNINETGDSTPGKTKKQKLNKTKNTEKNDTSIENGTQKNTATERTETNAKDKQKSEDTTSQDNSYSSTHKNGNYKREEDKSLHKPEGKTKKRTLDKTKNIEKNDRSIETEPQKNTTKDRIEFNANKQKNRNTISEDNNYNSTNSNSVLTSNIKREFNKDFPRGSNLFQNKYKAKKFNKKPAKIRDDKVHKRRKPDLGSSKIMINGMEVEIVKFDGFPVKKEDAERLTELKQKMIMKGIPKKEVDAAMKLERRKAEKALTRIKKCVCFHCRKAGHNLSDCPELGSERAATGICFKCGSTEHTHFECRVSKPTEFRYATCFICREQGHIAKQCPDNPRGVYPQGGACKVCGDVTHLKKDCPDLIREKEETAVTVDTIANGNLESLEEKTQSTEKEREKPKRIIKF
ncbi:splicing regulatory glutamine/lysine-rich protein 1-like [Ceratina calcarata]|uniref:Splicing regulatory glutamine/lysine-rich protein 1-like n=1 Tax=Ceratina calcarata TaxID=156304 RepID=A0AAJ7IY68_9HYME|nr:splicing regulatory glutamine/lysine-rich protein 1-like [Ceratina calcarata]